MKNGFTLVEILALLVLLGIIVLVAMPAFIESNKQADINKQKEFKDAVIIACESYVAAQDANATTVSISNLKNNGYMKNGLDKPEGCPDSVTISDGSCSYTCGS